MFYVSVKQRETIKRKKNSTVIFQENIKKFPKMYVEPQKILNSQNTHK